MSITHVERGVLGILAQAGGRHTFRPEGSGETPHHVFQREVVRILQSLAAKRLVTIDEGASRPIRLPGREGQYASMTAELTETGWGFAGVPRKGDEP